METSIDSAIQHFRRIIPKDHPAPKVRSVNELHDACLTPGQKIADAVAHNMGSWRFIIIQSTILLCWIIVNSIELIFRPWDPYPFILLNLALSFQAAYAAPFIMMSQNRQADKDRLAAEHDYCVNIRSDARIGAVLSHLQAQDDVMIAILRQLERVHRIEPDAAQQEAEERLKRAKELEGSFLDQVVRQEEEQAGLTPI